MEKEIIGRECKLARYAKARDGSGDDILLIKEDIHYNDGTIKPNLVEVINYKRDFYITKQSFRKHKQKKEWENIRHLRRFESTQAKLASSLASIMKRPSDTPLRRLNRSPYVYGTDISTVNLIKKRYKDKWPNTFKGMSVAVMDFETDVYDKDGFILSGALTYKDKAILAVTKKFLGAMANPEERIYNAFSKYLGEYKTSRNINLEIVIVDTPAQVVTSLIDKCHEWMPDLVAFWNITFDMDKMLQALEADGLDPADVFSHPNLPDKYRYFKWQIKKAKKETASGKKSNRHSADLWHVAYHCTSFYFVDAMSVFSLLRVAQGKRSSYSLDAILGSELELSKLKFPASDGYVGIDFHFLMQSKHKVEYLIYNLFDCIGVELLDEKNKDMSTVMPALSGISCLSRFDSMPSRLADDIHFYCLERDYVIGSTSDNMSSEDDDKILDMTKWIVTLPCHLRDQHTSLNIIEESSALNTDIYAMVSDLDVKSSYPTTEVILNISKETTHTEMSTIDGITEAIQRKTGLNMTNPTGNAVDICNDIFNMPDMDNMLELFKSEN